MKKRESGSKNMHIGKTFLFIFLFLLISSLLIKVYIVYKSNKFDGSNRINILAEKNNLIFSFSPKTNSAVIVRSNEKKPIDDLVEVPIDATIESDFELDRGNTFWNIEKLVASDSDLTIFDCIRLSLYVQSLSNSEIEDVSISDDMSEVEIKTISLSNFIDPEIGKENLRIEIVNGTEVPGLGNKIANKIINAGGDVIMVSNSFQKEKESKILFEKEETYTIKKLSKVFGLKKEKSSEQGIADVKIILGGNFEYD